MKTKILSIEQIDEAAEIFKNGGIVAFPTDTVYGLTSMDVDKIYNIKNRPRDKQLVMLCADIESTFVPEKYHDMVEKFWPGALTVIVNERGRRVPNCEVALEFIRKCGVPVMAPSANISGNPAPRTVQEVLRDLDGKIDAVIDGGECQIGVASTVLSLDESLPTILRKGSITKEELEKVFEIIGD